MEGMESLNPEVIGMILEQLQAVRMQDHEALEMEQDDVLRELMMQLGLLDMPTPMAGMSEGADELAVGAPPDALGDPMSAMLMGEGGPVGAGSPSGADEEAAIMAMLMGGAV